MRPCRARRMGPDGGGSTHHGIETAGVCAYPLVEAVDGEPPTALAAPPGEKGYGMTSRFVRGLPKVLALAVLLTAGVAEAQHHHRPATRRWIPEFDPAAAGAIATLLVGGGVMVARRRRR